MAVIYQCRRCPVTVVYKHVPGTNFGGVYHHGLHMLPLSLEGCD